MVSLLLLLFTDDIGASITHASYYSIKRLVLEHLLLLTFEPLINLVNGIMLKKQLV